MAITGRLRPQRICVYTAVLCRLHARAFQQDYLQPPRNVLPTPSCIQATSQSISGLAGTRRLMGSSDNDDSNSLIFHIDPVGQREESTLNHSYSLRELDRFYRQHMNHRAPPVKPRDLQCSLLRHQQSYQTTTSKSSTIQATLRISPRQQGWVFLRSLCVAEPERRQGLASKLLNGTLAELQSTFMLSEHDDASLTPLICGVYCFAEPNLSPLYTQAGFQMMMQQPINNSSSSHEPSVDNSQYHQDLSDSLLPRFAVDQFDSLVRKLSPKQNFAGLRLFFRTLVVHEEQNNQQSSSSSAGIEESDERQSEKEHGASPQNTNPITTHVILLQHTNEAHRRSATASLVENVADDLRTTHWQWSGRADNPTILQLLTNMVDDEERPTPILLWTGGKTTLAELDALPISLDASSSSVHVNSTIASNSTQQPKRERTFLLLDGTWQEAKSMFRKIPILYKLPRWTLQPTHASNYRLRQDWSGWKERFKADGQDAGDLLCTAEVVAEVEQQLGKTDNAQLIRQNLQDFQDDFHWR